MRQGDMVWCRTTISCCCPLMLRRSSREVNSRELHHSASWSTSDTVSTGTLLQLQDDDLLAAPSTYDSLRGGRSSSPPADDEGDYEGRDSASRSNATPLAAVSAPAMAPAVEARSRSASSFTLPLPLFRDLPKSCPCVARSCSASSTATSSASHTYDYARHFLSSCTRILGLPTMPNGAEFEGRYVHVGTYPIGTNRASRRRSAARERQGTHQESATTFRGGQDHRWCRPSRLHQGRASKLHALETFFAGSSGVGGQGGPRPSRRTVASDVEEYQKSARYGQRSWSDASTGDLERSSRCRSTSCIAR